VRITIHEGGLVILPANVGLQDLRGTVEPRNKPEDFGAVRDRARKAMARRRANPRGSPRKDG